MLNTITEGILKWKAARNLERVGRAQVISVCSRKGGVGKTTSAVHLAAAAARWHYRRVLIVDMDPQGHVATSLSACVGQKAGRTFSSVFADKQGDILDAAVATDLNNLWVVPADEHLEQVQMLLATRIGREFILKQAIAKAEDMFDLIVIDCPPNLDTLTLNALVASHSVVIPTDLSLLAVEGVADIAEAIETIRDRLGLPVEIAGILVARVDGRNRTINREIARMLSVRFGGLIMDGRIAAATAVQRACLQGTPVFDFAPGSQAAQDYQQATEELLDRIEA